MSHTLKQGRGRAAVRSRGRAGINCHSCWKDDTPTPIRRKARPGANSASSQPPGGIEDDVSPRIGGGIEGCLTGEGGEVGEAELDGDGLAAQALVFQALGDPVGEAGQDSW